MDQTDDKVAVSGWPSRGIMGVVDGWKAMPSGPGPAYICCQQPSPTVVVHNRTVQLVDLYKLSPRKRTGSTPAAAAAGGSGSKRAGAVLQQEAAKRQQQGATGIAAAAGAAVEQLLNKQQPQQQQQQQGLAGATAQQPAQYQQQQQRNGAVALTPLPNANSTPAAVAVAAAAAGAVSASKQLLQFTPEQMMLFSNKKLTELLKGCGLKVAGKKEDLVRRLLEYQRRVRKAAQGSNAAVGIAAAAGSRARV